MLIAFCDSPADVGNEKAGNIRNKTDGYLGKPSAWILRNITEMIHSRTSVLHRKSLDIAENMKPP